MVGAKAGSLLSVVRCRIIGYELKVAGLRVVVGAKAGSLLSVVRCRIIGYELKAAGLRVVVGAKADNLVGLSHFKIPINALCSIEVPHLE